MPLYEYECIKKGHRFEVIQKFSDPAVKVCVQCGSKVRKVLSAPAISFKGSGWYVTDHARSGSNGNGRGDGSKTPSDGPGAKADAKPKGENSTPSSATKGAGSSD